MKAKTLVPLIVGLVIGFFAIKMGVDMVRKAKGSQEQRRGVLVSTQSIDVAAEIKGSMLTMKEVAASLMPADGFTDAKAVIGRVTKIPIPAGVPITRAMLAPRGAEPGLAAKIPPGYRAVSVKVTEQTAVAGFITPGSHVDVSAVFGRHDPESRLILSNVEVGAVGQSLSRTGTDGKAVQIVKSVTLFLKPEQVETLNAAVGSGKGKIRLSLRGYGNEPSESFFSRLMREAMQRRVVQAPKAKPKAKPQPKYHVVEVHRGELAEQLVFDEHGGVRHVPMGGTPLPKASVASMSGAAPPMAGGGADQKSVKMETLE